MFEKLVESTKHKKNTRTSRLLLATTLVYASVLTAVGVATVFWFNPALADTMSVAAMLAPPPPPPPPVKTVIEKVENNRTVSPANYSTTAIPTTIPDPRTVPSVIVNRKLNFGVDGSTGGVPDIGVPGGEPDGVGEIPPPVPVKKPTPTPEPKPQPTPVPEKIRKSEGVLVGTAIRKVSPAYPAIAKAARIQGPVQVQVEISEEGQVTSASVLNGHPMLREAAVQAARQWLWNPTRLSNQPVKVQGILTFNFTLN